MAAFPVHMQSPAPRVALETTDYITELIIEKHKADGQEGRVGRVPCHQTEVRCYSDINFTEDTKEPFFHPVRFPLDRISQIDNPELFVS